MSNTPWHRRYQNYQPQKTHNNSQHKHTNAKNKCEKMGENCQGAPSDKRLKP